jgi:Carboxypeptidase regulatory-like domain
MVRVARWTVALSALATTTALAATQITGVVKDQSGALVDQAVIVLMTADQTPVATARTNEQGKFTIEAPAPGRYLLTATATHLGEARIPLTLGEASPAPLEIVLRVGALREEVTVTASVDLVDEVRRAGQRHRHRCDRNSRDDSGRASGRG